MSWPLLLFPIMTFAQQLKIRNARAMLDDLHAGKCVSVRKLENMLGTDRWERLQEGINLLREARQTRLAVPTYIIRAMRPYIDRLAEADRLEHLSERTSLSSMPSATTKRLLRMRGISISSRYSSREIFRTRAEAEYEKAIEKLHEVIDEFPEIRTYLDRYPLFDGENFNVTPDAAGVPRLRNSRSRYNMTRRRPVQSIRSLKTNALKNLIQELNNNFHN